jgi:hypothetical protein
VRISDVRELTAEEKQKKGGNGEVIGIRYGVYVVAPGSYFDGWPKANRPARTRYCTKARPTTVRRSLSS